MPTTVVQLEALRDQWLAAWPRALEAWSKYTRLRPPQLCLTYEEAAAEGLDSSFAMIRLTDQSVVVSLPEVIKSSVEPYALGDGYGHLALSVDDLDSEHARFAAAGLAPRPIAEMKRGEARFARCFFVQDPDGYKIEVL